MPSRRAVWGSRAPCSARLLDGERLGDLFQKLIVLQERPLRRPDEQDVNAAGLGVEQRRLVEGVEPVVQADLVQQPASTEPAGERQLLLVDRSERRRGLRGGLEGLVLL